MAVSGARPRVLIVEDDAGVRGALQRGLERDGFDITAVASAANALHVDRHDIALVDLGLPDGDGIDLCRRLRADSPTTPIIVVTGRRDELDVVDALDSGADDYVTKPFSLAVLSARIRRHLDRCSTTIVVGDTSFDMAMAVNEGAAGIGAGWGYHEADELIEAGALAVAERPLDVLDVIREHV